ncbi:transcription initiation factor TFIID subunit 10, putative [Babesia caballi]|uniref:Transcription initiation factor TFIID subunit 10, putative n=1 Tax=Babesia caballi TaxID=5871 RepID=A0AAV4M2Z2_BABCB|nr:transcription initiation factor TFIID subunit 10, putative [Babesia caballi]
MARSGAPNIDVEVVKGLSQPSALHDELVRYILSTVGCKLHNESTLRLVSHAAQMALEKLLGDYLPLVLHHELVLPDVVGGKDRATLDGKVVESNGGVDPATKAGLVDYVLLRRRQRLHALQQKAVGVHDGLDQLVAVQVLAHLAAQKLPVGVALLVVDLLEASYLGLRVALKEVLHDDEVVVKHGSVVGPRDGGHAAHSGHGRVVPGGGAPALAHVPVDVGRHAAKGAVEVAAEGEVPEDVGAVLGEGDGEVRGALGAEALEQVEKVDYDLSGVNLDALLLAVAAVKGGELDDDQIADVENAVADDEHGLAVAFHVRGELLVLHVVELEVALYHRLHALVYHGEVALRRRRKLLDAEQALQLREEDDGQAVGHLVALLLVVVGGRVDPLAVASRRPGKVVSGASARGHAAVEMERVKGGREGELGPEAGGAARHVGAVSVVDVVLDFGLVVRGPEVRREPGATVLLVLYGGGAHVQVRVLDVAQRHADVQALGAVVDAVQVAAIERIARGGELGTGAATRRLLLDRLFLGGHRRRLPVVAEGDAAAGSDDAGHHLEVHALEAVRVEDHKGRLERPPLHAGDVADVLEDVHAAGRVNKVQPLSRRALGL